MHGDGVAVDAPAGEARGPEHLLHRLWLPGVAARRESGLARCSACGGWLTGNAQGKYFTYVCRSEGCGMTASGLQLDAHVDGMVLPRVIQESKAMRFVDVPPHGEELHDLEQEREDVRQRAVRGEVPSEMAFPASRRSTGSARCCCRVAGCTSCDRSSLPGWP